MGNKDTTQLCHQEAFTNPRFLQSFDLSINCLEQSCDFLKYEKSEVSQIDGHWTPPGGSVGAILVHEVLVAEKLVQLARTESFLATCYLL